MKALILKLLTDGLDPAAVAAQLRELADSIEQEGLKDTDLGEGGALSGTVRVAARKPVLRPLGAPAPATKKPAKPRCDVGRAARLASALLAEILHGLDGSAGIVLEGLLTPVTEVSGRLTALYRAMEKDRPEFGIRHVGNGWVAEVLTSGIPRKVRFRSQVGTLKEATRDLDNWVNGVVIV